MDIEAPDALVQKHHDRIRVVGLAVWPVLGAGYLSGLVWWGAWFFMCQVVSDMPGLCHGGLMPAVLVAVSLIGASVWVGLHLKALGHFYGAEAIAHTDSMRQKTRKTVTALREGYSSLPGRHRMHVHNAMRTSMWAAGGMLTALVFFLTVGGVGVFAWLIQLLFVAAIEWFIWRVKQRRN